MNHILILAGGKGSRMGSDCPKVLTDVAEIPIIYRQLENLKKICEIPTVVVGFGSEQVIEKVGERAEYVLQSQQLGTGHAVLCAKEKLENKDFKNIVVLPGDHPLISAETIKNMISLHEKSSATTTISYVKVPKYKGIYEVFYNCGRIVRDSSGEISDIVELRDADEDQKNINEVNVSYYCFDAKWLWENIGRINNDNVAGEYYLTDLIGIAKKQGRKVASFRIENPEEGMGVNTPEQKEIIERIIKN